MLCIVRLTSVPRKLRGLVELRLTEMDPNLFIGNISARVRDELWKQIEEFVGDGRASMVVPANTEQGFTIKHINSRYTPTDHEGVLLMKKTHKRKQKQSDPELGA